MADAPSMSLWRRALDVGQKTGALSPDAQRKAEEALLTAPSLPSVAELALTIGVSADVLESLIALARDMPEDLLPPRTAPTQIESQAPRTALLDDAASAPDVRAQPSPAQPERTSPLLGDIGRYRLMEQIGEGGMGAVYRALDITLGREVALKVLLVRGRVEEDAIERFEREAKAAASLDHPNPSTRASLRWGARSGQAR